jgi:diguanylate cyclase (GGDEF)-like protein
VHVRSGDEFGEMAQAFNDMAGRLENQFDELEALAAIDRNIIEHRALDAILGQVASRLAWLTQGGTVAIGRLTGDGLGPAVCLVLRSGETGVTRHLLNVDRATMTRWFDAGAVPQPEHVERWPSELRELQLGSHAKLRLLPLVTHNHCLGFLAIGCAAASPLGESELRQVTELRNRAAVAVSAADREDALLHEARHDSLTGLLNRAGLLDAMHVAGQRASADAPVTVLFIDVDRFKAVNDSHGHAIGDQVLKDVAARITRRLPMGALLARPSGDEFVAVLQDAFAPDAVARLAQALCSDLVMVSVANVGPVLLGASIGIAFQDDPSQPVEELLRHADQAMYAAKRRGKGRHAFFEPELDVAAQRYALIERELPLAIERHELRLVYQPRVDAQSRQIHSVEALVRWHHPSRGLCLPSEFIPVAEDSDLIERLGLWVLETACAQVQAWRAAGLTGLRVAVNLSARQLKSERLESDLSQAMARHGVIPDDLELEITESVFVGDSDDVGARLQRLRAMGLLIALDDFGTGYSSMSYLRKLPVDVLKIDRSFVLDLDDDPAAIAVARAIVALASSLKLRTVAEGVETEGQLQLLTEMGCNEVQGYYFSRPVGPDAVQRLVDQARLPSPSLA